MIDTFLVAYYLLQTVISLSAVFSVWGIVWLCYRFIKKGCSKLW